VLQDLAPAVFSAGIVFGLALRLFEERPLVMKIRQSRQVKKESAVLQELEATETFIADLSDDTSDDLRLQRYKPKRVRNAAPLAIAAAPSNTLHNMTRIRLYMEQHGPNRQHTQVLTREANKD
jgi:hypothetical protein